MSGGSSSGGSSSSRSGVRGRGRGWLVRSLGVGSRAWRKRKVVVVAAVVVVVVVVCGIGVCVGSKGERGEECL
jgi:hypothetical protein